MPNALTVTLTASDKATKVVQDFTKRVNQLTRPFQNLQRSIGRFAHAAGFDVVKKKLEGLTQTARGVVSAFSRIGAPLLALVGGGTIAGLVALTDGWARFGLQLSQTAQILGVNTQDLYNFQNAARLVGISGDTATQSFTAFADTLQDARWGRNQGVMQLLLGLHMQLKTTKTGALDTADMLGQVADRIQRYQKQGNTGAARTLARQLGVTDLLPFLMLGRKGMEAYEAQSQRLAGKMNWQQAANAAMQWRALDVAMSGAKNTIAEALLPTISPLVEQFGAWVSANRTLIATNVGDFVKGLGAAFKGISLKGVLDDILAIIKALLGLGDDIASVVGALGGLKTVLEGMAGIWAVSKIVKYGMALSAARKAFLAWRAARAVASAGGTAAEAGTAAAAGAPGAAATAGLFGLPTLAGLLGATGIGLLGGATVYGGAKLWEHHELAKLDKKIVVAPMAPVVRDFFMREGWTAAQAAGITANIQRESNFDPNAVGDHGAARGIGQWHADRQALFNAWAQKNNLKDLAHADLPEQLQFYNYELRNSEAQAGNKLSGATNAFDAGSIVSLYDERPANGNEEASARGALAAQIAAQPPQLNVSVQTTVQKDGSTTTKVQTPTGAKIVHTNPVDSVS